jgi:hypothetical protein
MNQGGKGLFSKDFISAFNSLSILAMSFFSGPDSLFSIKSKSPAKINPAIKHVIPAAPRT